MKSITLINLPSEWMMSDTVYPPLGLLYLASYIRQFGVEVKFMDMAGNDNMGILPKTEYYGIGFTTPQIVKVKEMIKQIRTKHPKSKIIAGGIHATSLPQETLELGFDCVIRGEGEISMSKIICEGITKPIYPIKYIKDLDSLPFPALDMINIEKYVTNLDVTKYLSKGYNIERQISMITSRGCPFSCNYCSMYKGNIRFRSINNIISEIKELVKKYNINRIRFNDDNFTIMKERVVKLCSELKNVGMGWSCLGRADNENTEIYKIMKESGCLGIDFGIESGSQKILDIANKKANIKNQSKGIIAAYKSGLKVRAQMMIGLPGETDDTITETIKFIQKHNKYVTKWGLHTFIPFPSCKIYSFPSQFNYTIDYDFNNYHTIGKKGEWDYVPPDFKDKIEMWRDKIFKAIGEKDIQNKVS